MPFHAPFLAPPKFRKKQSRVSSSHRFAAMIVGIVASRHAVMTVHRAMIVVARLVVPRPIAASPLPSKKLSSPQLRA